MEFVVDFFQYLHLRSTDLVNILDHCRWNPNCMVMNSNMFRQLLKKKNDMNLLVKFDVLFKPNFLWNVIKTEFSSSSEVNHSMFKKKITPLKCLYTNLNACTLHMHFQVISEFIDSWKTTSSSKFYFFDLENSL